MPIFSRRICHWKKIMLDFWTNLWYYTIVFYRSVNGRNCSPRFNETPRCLVKQLQPVANSNRFFFYFKWATQLRTTKKPAARSLFLEAGFWCWARLCGECRIMRSRAARSNWVNCEAVRMVFELRSEIELSELLLCSSNAFRNFEAIVSLMLLCIQLLRGSPSLGNQRRLAAGLF